MESNNNYSFPVSIQKAKAEIIKATNTAMIKYQLPAFVLEGILSGLIADIRSQIAVDLANENEQLLLQIEALQPDREENANG